MKIKTPGYPVDTGRFLYICTSVVHRPFCAKEPLRDTAPATNHAGYPVLIRSGQRPALVAHLGPQGQQGRLQIRHALADIVSMDGLQLLAAPVAVQHAHGLHAHRIPS